PRSSTGPTSSPRSISSARWTVEPIPAERSTPVRRRRVTEHSRGRLFVIVYGYADTQPDAYHQLGGRSRRCTAEFTPYPRHDHRPRERMTNRAQTRGRQGRRLGGLVFKIVEGPVPANTLLDIF